MLCKYHWIVLYTVHFTAFCLGGPFFPGHGVYFTINLIDADLTSNSSTITTAVIYTTYCTVPSTLAINCVYNFLVLIRK